MYAKIGEKKRLEPAATFVLDRECHANEGWTMRPVVSGQMCTDVDPVLTQEI